MNYGRITWKLEWRRVRIANRYGSPNLYGMPLDWKAVACFAARGAK